MLLHVQHNTQSQTDTCVACNWHRGYQFKSRCQLVITPVEIELPKFTTVRSKSVGFHRRIFLKQNSFVNWLENPFMSRRFTSYNQAHRCGLDRRGSIACTLRSVKATESICCPRIVALLRCLANGQRTLTVDPPVISSKPYLPSDSFS